MKPSAHFISHHSSLSTTKMTPFVHTLAVVAVALCATSANAFAPLSTNRVAFQPRQAVCSRVAMQAATEEDKASEAVFMPPEEGEEPGNETFEKVESLGRGAAKAKRGKRKGAPGTSSTKKAAASLAPEEVFYEGPPAITETIAPTISILTVVGIIPAAAAWARQAWVRYKITSRRVRVTSGIGGKEMAEIVYPDIVELRTAKRLFGDGDMVAFLRDGARFEIRNVPNFEEAIEFVLKYVDKEVAEQYREGGDVTNPQ